MFNKIKIKITCLLTKFTLLSYCINCMQRGLVEEQVVRPSVSMSVSLANARFVTKQKKVMPTLLYHMKDPLS